MGITDIINCYEELVLKLDECCRLKDEDPDNPKIKQLTNEIEEIKSKVKKRSYKHPESETSITPFVIIDYYIEFLERKQECIIFKMEDPNHPRIDELISEMEDLVSKADKDYYKHHPKD